MLLSWRQSPWPRSAAPSLCCPVPLLPSLTAGETPAASPTTTPTPLIYMQITLFCSSASGQGRLCIGKCRNSGFPGRPDLGPPPSDGRPALGYKQERRGSFRETTNRGGLRGETLLCSHCREVASTPPRRAPSWKQVRFTSPILKRTHSAPRHGEARRFSA